MSNDVPKLTRRERYARETKDAIISAARQLFAERGYFATTIEDIAAAADVAPATVYSSVGGKQGVLSELLQQWGQDPAIQTTLNAIRASVDPLEIIETLATAACAMREDWDDAVWIFQTTTPHDSELAERFAPFNAFYRQCIADIAERLADMGALRDGADTAYATDVLWLYFGYGSIATLRHENAWPYDRIRDWLAAQAARELLTKA
jgi:AcrR family transcriptional regulator